MAHFMTDKAHLAGIGIVLQYQYISGDTGSTVIMHRALHIVKSQHVGETCQVNTGCCGRCFGPLYYRAATTAGLLCYQLRIFCNGMACVEPAKDLRLGKIECIAANGAEIVADATAAVFGKKIFVISGWLGFFGRSLNLQRIMAHG